MQVHDLRGLALLVIGRRHEGERQADGKQRRRRRREPGKDAAREIDEDRRVSEIGHRQALLTPCVMRGNCGGSAHAGRAPCRAANSLVTGKNAGKIPRFSQFSEKPSRKAKRIKPVPAKFPARPNREILSPCREFKFPARSKAGISRALFARHAARTASMGDLLQREVSGPRPEDPDRRHHDRHRRGDEDEDAEGAEPVQHEGDDEGGEDHREPAPGIDEAGGARPDPGREQLLLVGVEAVGEDVVRERKPQAHGDDERGLARLAEYEAEAEDQAGRADDDPFALEPVAEGKADQRPDRRGERDERRVAEAGRDGDPLFDEQGRDPVAKP